MPYIKVNLQRLQQLDSQLGRMSTRIGSASTVISSVRSGLDWDVACEESIDRQLRNIANRLDTCRTRMDNTAIAVDNAVQAYSKAEGIDHDNSTVKLSTDAIFKKVDLPLPILPRYKPHIFDLIPKLKIKDYFEFISKFSPVILDPERFILIGCPLWIYRPGAYKIDAYLYKLVNGPAVAYWGKVSGEVSNSLKTDLGKLEIIDNLKKGINEKFEDEGLRIDENDDPIFIKDGKVIPEKQAPDFHKREVAILEVKNKTSVEVEHFDESVDYGNGKLSATVGQAEAHGSISGGFYITNADGSRSFAPGIEAEIGASMTALSADWEHQWFGDDNLGVETNVELSAGKIGAEGSFTVDFSDDVQVDVGFSAEAIAAEAELSGELEILGGGIEGEVGLNVGIGAHADVGYTDGVFKLDAGASLGLGISLDVEIDVGGIVDTVVDGATSAIEGIGDWWDSIWS